MSATRFNFFHYCSARLLKCRYFFFFRFGLNACENNNTPHKWAAYAQWIMEMATSLVMTIAITNWKKQRRQKKNAATITTVNFMKEQCNYHCKPTNGIWAAWKKFVPWWIQNGVLVANKWATIFDYLVYATLIFARRFSLVFLSQPKAQINSWTKGRHNC